MLLHETTIRRRIEYITIYILYCEIGGISRLLRATLVWRQVTVKLSIGSTFIVGGGLETLFFFCSPVLGLRLCSCVECVRGAILRRIATLREWSRVGVGQSGAFVLFLLTECAQFQISLAGRLSCHFLSVCFAFAFCVTVTPCRCLCSRITIYFSADSPKRRAL